MLLRKGCQWIWQFPALITGLSAACQALGDRAGDRKQHHKGIPSIMFFHDINICHTTLTVLYYTPGVRHRSIIQLQHEPKGSENILVRVNAYVSSYICLKEREGLWIFHFFCLVPVIKHCLSYYCKCIRACMHACMCFSPTRIASVVFCTKAAFSAHKPLQALEPKVEFGALLQDVCNEMIHNAQYQGGAAILR